MLQVFDLRRWEHYCLLALASTTWMCVVGLKTHPVHAVASLLTHLTPVEAQPRDREPKWVLRHAAIRAKTEGPYDVLLLGDSITQGWELQQKTWQGQMPQARVVNAGISSDRVENVLWRVRHGLFTKQQPKVVVLMAGINNLALAPAAKIAGGLAQIIGEIRRASPTSQILLLGLLPSGEAATHPRREKIRHVNDLLATLSDGQHVHYLDVGRHFLTPAGVFTREISFDGVHLTKRGYAIWARSLKSPVSELLGNVSH